MAVNAASSTYVNNASSSNGFSGLASGIDTESMVEQLLSGTQSKIDKQEGVKQQLQWKQEIYRNIISQINAFQSKYFSYTSSSNLASASFWNSLSVFASSSAFKATASTSAATGTSSMAVRRLATKTSLTSGSPVSGSLSGNLDTSALRDLVNQQLNGDYSVKFNVGGTTVNVDLKDVFVSEDGKSFNSYTTPELDSALQKKLQDAFDAAETGVKVTVTDGAVSIVSSGNDRQRISVASGSGALGLQKLGLTAASSSVDKADDKTATLSGTVDAVPKMEFSVTLDDLKKTVSIDLRQVIKDGSVDKTLLKEQLQAGLDKAHGKDQIKVEDDGSGFRMVVSAGRKVDISGSEEALDVLGMKDGDSNRISLSSKLSDLNLGTKLRGGDYRFTINGEEFHFTGDTAIIDVMDIINRSDAGVRMVYRAQDDKFVLETKESGAGKQIDMQQTEGNLLNALFGGGFDVGSINSRKITTTDFRAPGTASKYTLDDDKTEETTTLADLKIKKLGDLDVETVTLEQLKEASGGKYYYTTDDDGRITIMQRFKGSETTLSDLGYNITGLENVALYDLEEATKGKLVYDSRNGVIVLNGYYAETADSTTTSALNSLFGNGMALGGGAGEPVIVEGQNAEVMIDGVITERSSNNFTVNGINYDISDITGSYSAANMAYAEAVYDEDTETYTYTDADGKSVKVDAKDLVEIDGKKMAALGYYLDENGNRIDEKDLVEVGGEMKKFTGTAATVTVSQDTDSIIDALKGFIDEYNVLVKTLNDLLDEDTNYRDYPPLTSAQKAEMSEREIELWEQKAKEGLLHGDNSIQTFLQQMRTALYQKPEGAKYALYELGIETGEWEMKGQLSFTLNGEANLRSLLENDPAGVASLFTTVNGLGTTLNDILKQTASTSSGSPGTLVQLAGVKDSDTSSSIYNQLKAIDEKIEALKRTYEAEKTRYWKQFNTMEQLISEMNTQSAYLYQMMGMSY